MPVPRILSSLALVVTLVVLAQPAAAGEPVLDPPVRGPVLARFDAPTTYGRGHRGVDFGVVEGSAVRASAAGVVTFAGLVVGDLWVTVDHGPVRTTVGPLSGVDVARGDRVVRGSIVGRSGRAHGLPALHWSARRGDRYVDPLRVGRRRASLVPSDGGVATARTARAGPKPSDGGRAPAAVPRARVR